MKLLTGQRRGLYTNSDWAPETAGTFAVIIGISSYAYLKDGDGENRPEENYDLGQLPVSALTATRFFEWLRDHYQLTGAPLAKCWLLLAPSEDEAKVYGTPFPPSDQPTLAGCQTAIEEWFAAVRDLPAAAAEQSRVLFFFSGHGVEIYPQKQLLLPCDYLRPPAHAASQAMSSYNISVGMAALAAKHQFFFVDACRNDLERLRETQSLDGLKILDEKVPGLLNRALVGPIFYAAGSGSVAWSPISPKDGISYFGQAVLEALKAEAQFRPDCDKRQCRVMVSKFGPFIEGRVPNLIPIHRAEAFVKLGGIGAFSEGVITELPPRRRTTRGIAPDAGQPPGRPQPPLTSVPLPSANWRPGDDPGRVYTVLESEFATHLFVNATAIPLGRDRGAAPSKPVIHSVDRTPDKDLYRIEVSVPRGAHWLQFVDLMPKTNRTYACVLPGDAVDTPRYRLEWSTGIRDNVGHVTRLEAILSPSNTGALKEAATLWELYQALDLTGTLKSTDLLRLEERLRDKIDSPLAAVVAGTVLLRLRRHDLLHGWLRNLANWFPDIPDGPVLWAEQMLQTDGRAIENRTLLEFVLQLRTRGLPYTSEALGYADQQVRRLLQATTPTPPERDELETLRDRIDRALRYFQSGGLFAVFLGSSTAVTADLIAPGGASVEKPVTTTE
jgi:hypothetical protein